MLFAPLPHPRVGCLSACRDGPGYDRLVNPPITVRCDCGRVERVPYGDRWRCPDCEQQWNTNQIPAEDYYGIMTQMKRYRLQAIGIALCFGLAFLVGALVMGQRVMMLAPVVMGAWFFLYMPQWRRKVRAATRDLPTWQLHPE